MTTVLRKTSSKSWKSDGLEITIDADTWARTVAEEALRLHIAAIKAGNTPEGNGQKPLKAGTWRAKKAAKGVRPRARGFTEHAIFVRSLRVKRVRGSKKAAEYELGTDLPEVFAQWLSDEEARGVEYFGTGGQIDRAVDKSLSDLLDRAVK